MLDELLYEAGASFGRLSNPAALPHSQEAVEEARRFMAAEARVHALPGAVEELKRHVRAPLDPSGRTPNHAMLAGLILARSGWPGSAAALLDAAASQDEWCSGLARLNLSWLAPTEENRAALLEAAARAGHDTLAGPTRFELLDALVRQRAPEVVPAVGAYLLRGEGTGLERAWVLTEFVTLMPEEGLEAAAAHDEGGDDLLSLTALGLRAVYDDAAAYERLRRRAGAAAVPPEAALRWLGRVACPASAPLLLKGLEHPSPAMRCDVVTSLALLGTKEALEAVVRALSDRAREVSDQAMALLFALFGEELGESAHGLGFEPDGRLGEAGRARLSELLTRRLDELAPGLRHQGATPVLPVHYLEHLYRGFLPDHAWFHWVSMTGQAQPFDVHKNFLYNYPTLERLEDWHLAHAQDLTPGLPLYHLGDCPGDA